MNLKVHNKCGFTLIEVLISLSITAVVFSPILILYGTALRGVGYYIQVLERTRYAQNFLINQNKQTRLTKQSNQKRQKNNVDDPEMKFLYEQDAISKTSPLYRVTDLQRQRITMEWENEVEQIVSFIYVPKES